MNKKEKYINYIVDDLISKTIFDQYEDEEYNSTYITKGGYTGMRDGLFIMFPFKSKWYEARDPNKGDLFTTLFPPFSKYLKEKYGARDEEIKIIWDSLKQRIQSLIN